MGASASTSEDVTAVSTGSGQAAPSCSSLEDEIERSKSHWSEMVKSSESISPEEEAALKLENREAFNALMRDPTWGHFFFPFGYETETHRNMGSLVLGEKFAEGSQAELFHAHVEWSLPEYKEMDREFQVEYVVKVFKKGTLVRNLQLQWPHGYIQWLEEARELKKLGKLQGKRYYSNVRCATLLEDGRFAFLMVKEHEDLRRLIDRKMLESGDGCGPFSKDVGEEVMYRVALGMHWLHSHDIVHRDLKASNVLIRTSPRREYIRCFVADFESSVGVIGTGFWRAPEILQACRERNVNDKPKLFSKATDAYSYGMTCYEILIGRLPFEGEPMTMDHVIQGARPKLSNFIDGLAHELLGWCWQSNPAKRPSFEQILSFLEANSSSEFIRSEVDERKKGDEL